MVAAAGNGNFVLGNRSMSHRGDDAAQDDLQDSEHATLATTLAMLAHAPHPGYPVAQLHEIIPDDQGTPHAQQTPSKRSGTTAGLAGPQHTKQQRLEGGEYDSTPPDSPLSATAAAAAAAGLHKLSSASAAEFDAALVPYRETVDGMPEVIHGLLTARLHSATGASGVNINSTPAQIMQQLVECGVLPACGPDTHCFVKCGLVQGVFSLASGTIVCLCDSCSDSNHGEPTWFAPAAFERHGGMAASKKWRGSIQVKGLTQRKTLGQWLDERGVTAKPRLTLADQVQQAGGSRQRGNSSTVAGRVSAGGNELAAAAANAARLAGLGKAAGPNGRARPAPGRAGGVVGHTSGPDSEGLDVCSPAGLPQLDAAPTATAGLSQLDVYSQAAEHAPPGAAAAPAEQQVSPAGGWVANLQRLLAEAAAPAPSPALTGLQQQQQQQFSSLLQQLQNGQQQQVTSSLAPSLLLAPPAATPADDPLARLVRLLPNLLPAGACSAATPPAALPAASVAVGLAAKPEENHQADALADATTADDSQCAAEPPVALLLTLATAKAVSEPLEAFKLLAQALQQQLHRCGLACKQAATAASTAVAAAGERICGQEGSTVSTAAAFAAIAAAAAAAAAAVADQCQQQAAVQQPRAQQQQKQTSPQQQVPSWPQQQQGEQQQQQHHHHHQHHQQQQEQEAPLGAAAQASSSPVVVQDLLSAAPGVDASVVQLMAGMLGGQTAMQQQQQGTSGAYGALVNVLLRGMGDATAPEAR